MSKYSIFVEVEEEVIKNNMKRLINQIWKLIPMRENNEDWKYQLESVLIELIGFQKTFNKLDLTIPITKLNGLKYEEDVSFRQYRSKVFSVIDFLGGV